MLRLSDFRKYRQFNFWKIGSTCVHLRIKSVYALEMTMYVHWTCVKVNRKDVHTSMISFNLKRYVNHSFEKKKPQLCFFLKKTFSSLIFI